MNLNHFTERCSAVLSTWQGEYRSINSDKGLPGLWVSEGWDG